MFSVPSHPRCCICQCIISHLTGLLQGEILCHICIEDVKRMIALARVHGDVGKETNRPFADVTKVMKKIVGASMDMKEKMNQMAGTASDMNKINFLMESLTVFKEQIQSDIQLKPGCNGPSKPAHRALLAAKSEIFKNMLDPGDFKAQSDTITLAELNAEELESLVEFVYLGSLPKEKMNKHACALFAATHKYEIPYLHEICTSHLLASLSKANAFDILEIADTCSHKSLKATTLSFILQNMEDFVFSEKYESFVVKNPILCMEITRAFVAKKNNCA